MQGKENSKLETNKFKFMNTAKNKDDTEVFGHTESKSGLCFGLSLLLEDFLSILVGTHDGFASLFELQSFWSKIDNQAFQNTCP